MKNTLPLKFYAKPTLTVAKELLGKYIFRNHRGYKLVGKIVETEAYIGFDDQASHAARGKTKRNEVMFGHGGRAYIYMIYGKYYCLNIATEKSGFPAAVLIRAIEPISGIEQMAKNRNIKSADKKNISNGPGKLCQALKIDKNLNGIGLQSDKLWLANGKCKIKDNAIVSARRIGIDYAGSSKDLLWRFYLKDNLYISQK